MDVCMIIFIIQFDLVLLFKSQHRWMKMIWGLLSHSHEQLMYESNHENQPARVKHGRLHLIII